MVLTVCRLVVSPFLRVKVTPPEAPDQETLNGEPATIPEKLGLVNWTALVTAKAAAARMSLVNCILTDLVVFKKL